MKAKLHTYLQWLREGAVRVVSSHPVEMALAFVAMVGGLLIYEDLSEYIVNRLLFVPLFFMVALAVNNLSPGRWRFYYWLSWTPLVPIMLWSGGEAWVESSPFRLALGVLAPLAVLMCRRALINERFVNDGVVWLRSVVLAGLFANVALGLFCAILYSTTYIFGLSGAWVGDVAMYVVIVTEALVFPTLLLMISDDKLGCELRGGHVVDVLINYILTPALLIYTVILYLYMAKILVMWTLPDGGVAYMVFGFTLAALAVKALQQLLSKRIYDWFFDRFSLVSLPLLVLFWIGVVRRVGEYGFTEPRVYLVVCGALMTLCVMLFLTPRLGRYIWVCLAGFITFGALAFVPSLNPERIAVDSQYNRALGGAVALEMLDDTGRLVVARFAADTTRMADYHRLYESLAYISFRDSARFARFGVEMDAVREGIPVDYYDLVVDGRQYRRGRNAKKFSVYSPEARAVEGLNGYTTLYTNMRYTVIDDDTLRIRFNDVHPEVFLAASELLTRQFARAGIQEAQPSETLLQAAAKQLLCYEDEQMMILFSAMHFERRDSVLKVESLSVDAVLTR